MPWNRVYSFRCWASCGLPPSRGPNNLLLTTSGANFGFMRSLWLMVGIMLGMQSILLLVAFGVGSLIWSTRRCT